MLIIPFSDTRWVLAYLYPLIHVSESELSDTQVLITWEFLNELGLLQLKYDRQIYIIMNMSLNKKKDSY